MKCFSGPSWRKLKVAHYLQGIKTHDRVRNFVDFKEGF